MSGQGERGGRRAGGFSAYVTYQPWRFTCFIFVFFRFSRLVFWVTTFFGWFGFSIGRCLTAPRPRHWIVSSFCNLAVLLPAAAAIGVSSALFLILFFCTLLLVKHSLVCSAAFAPSFALGCRTRSCVPSPSLLSLFLLLFSCWLFPSSFCSVLGSTDLATR